MGASLWVVGGECLGVVLERERDWKGGPRWFVHAGKRKDFSVMIEKTLIVVKSILSERIVTL